MLLTKPQTQRFWREWARVKADLASKGYTPAQIEAERRNLIRESTGHDSLTEVDPHDDFTSLLRHLAIMQSDLSGVLRADQNPRRQIIWQIRRAPEAYWQKISQDRFGTTDLDALTEDQLTQLRNTLADRKVEQHQNSTRRVRNAKARARRAAKADAPEPRIQFPDIDGAPTMEESPESFRRAEVTAGEIPDDSNPF